MQYYVDQIFQFSTISKKFHTNDTKLIFSNFRSFYLYIIFNNVFLHETFQNFPFPMEIYQTHTIKPSNLYENFPSLSSISNNTARFSSNSSHRTRVPDVLELWATIPSHWFIGRIIRSIREPIGPDQSSSDQMSKRCVQSLSLNHSTKLIKSGFLWNQIDIRPISRDTIAIIIFWPPISRYFTYHLSMCSLYLAFFLFFLHYSFFFFFFVRSRESTTILYVFYNPGFLLLSSTIEEISKFLNNVIIQ